MKSHLHFLGVGGVSMSGLARHYLAKGHRVSGCDAIDSEVVRQLRAEGIEVAIGHDSSHVEGVDTVVATMAVSESSEEIVAARSAGIRTMQRIDLLAELFGDYRTIAVTGSHGKSTTTGMIAQVFLATGRDPTVQLGASLPALGRNMRVGAGRELIAEVDESDPGFARLRPEVAVLINLEDDHIAGEHDERRNYHASLADLERATRRFASHARRVVACADWPELERLLEGVPSVATYGLDEKADYRVMGLELSASGSRFTLLAPGAEEVEVTLSVPGLHNVQNAAAALATAHLEGLPLVDAAQALAGFGGVGRRWQRWGNGDGAMIIDDYAHHPTEVVATLKAALNTGRRVRAVLQPHRWVRTARHWPALADAAGLAHEVIVLDVYSAGEKEIAGVSVDLIVDRLREAGISAVHHDHRGAVSYLRETLGAEDLVITLGAGDVWKVAQELSGGGAQATGQREVVGADS